MPRELLSPAGYLPEMQTKIRSLSLIASTECSETYNQEDIAEPILLTPFNQLRKFSWVGLRSPKEFQTLRKLLHANHDNLEDLVLENSSSPRANDPRSEHKQFLGRVLPQVPDGSKQCFPPLRSLSLSEISCISNTGMSAPAIEFSQSRSLNLHNCEDTSIILHGVVTSGKHIALKHLDLKFQDRIYHGWDTSSLVSFLEWFQGLEHLYLMTDPRLPTETYRNSISGHQSTLKCF